MGRVRGFLSGGVPSMCKTRTSRKSTEHNSCKAPAHRVRALLKDAAVPQKVLVRVAPSVQHPAGQRPQDTFQPGQQRGYAVVLQET